MAETLKKWEEISRSYRVYIKLEKRLSENTVESYMRDLRQFAHFILRFYDVPPRKVEASDDRALPGPLVRSRTGENLAGTGVERYPQLLQLPDADRRDRFYPDPVHRYAQIRPSPSGYSYGRRDRSHRCRRRYLYGQGTAGQRDARSPLFVRAARFGASPRCGWATFSSEKGISA